jgi:16S rRNA (guanine527-N7)-methyltransferase
MKPEQELTLGIEQLGILATDDQQKKMLSYLSILQKWNKVYSLTAVRDIEQMVSLHLLDSLAVLPYLWPGRWLDVGCGPGLPGIVLAILQPQWAFTLLDSNSKKTSFVQQAVIELGITNIQVCCNRVEDWQVEEKFDGIISRAFADVAEFTQLSRHLLKQEGSWVAMKGQPKEELHRLPINIEVKQVVPLQIPGLEASRCLVILKEI